MAHPALIWCCAHTKKHPFHQQCCYFTTYIFSLQPLYYFVQPCPTLIHGEWQAEKVHALALHVSNLSECSRQYGSNAKSKLVNGRVISVQNTPTATGRTSTLVRALYKLDRETAKKAELNIRSVRSGWVDGPNLTCWQILWRTHRMELQLQEQPQEQLKLVPNSCPTPHRSKLSNQLQLQEPPAMKQEHPRTWEHLITRMTVRKSAFPQLLEVELVGGCQPY
jgi:hypothetical protein